MNDTITNAIVMMDQTGRLSDFQSVLGTLAMGVLPIDNVAF